MYRRWLQQFAEGLLCLGSASSCSHANKKSGVVGRLLQRHRWWNASTTPQRRPSYAEHSVVRNKHYHDRGAGLDHSLEAQCRLLTSSERRQRLLRDVSLGLPTSPSLSTSAATTTGGTTPSHTTSAADVRSLHALAATHYATWLCGVSRAIRRVPGYANTMFSSLISQRRRRQRRSMKRSSSRISNNATVTTAAHRTHPRIARWRAWRANVSRRTFQRCGDDDSLFTFALQSTPQSKPFLRSVLLRTCMQYEKLNVFSARQLTENIRVKRLRDGLHTLGIVEDPRRVLMNQTTIQHTPFFQKCVKAFPAARRHTKQFEVHAFLMRRRIQKIVALHYDTSNRSSNTVDNESQFDGRHVSHDQVNPSKDKKPKKRKNGSLTAPNGGVGVVAAASASPVTSYDILCRNWWLRDGGGQPFRMMDATRSCAYSQEIHTNAAISAVSSPLRQSQWNTVSFETELCHSIDDLMLADQEALAAWAAPRELVLPSGSTSTHSIQEGSPSLDSVSVGDNTSSSPLPPPPSHLGRLLGIYENTLIAHSPLITDERLEPKQFDYSAHEEIIQKHFADRLRNMETHVDAIPSPSAIMETASSSSPTSMTRDGQMRPTSLWSASATKRNALMLKRKQQNMPNTLRSLLMTTTTSRHSDGPSADAPPPPPSNPAEEALSDRVVPPRLGDSAEYSLLLSKLRRRHPHPCRDISALMTTARRFQHTPRQVFIEKRHEQAFRDAVMREREEQFPQSQQGGQEVGVVSAHTTTADAHQRSSLPLVLHAQEAVGVVADEYLIRQFECENDVLKSLRSQATLALESQEDAVSRVERFESLFNGLRATARSSARDKDELSCAC